MAKGKNARALFEVIKQAQQRQAQARRAVSSATPVLHTDDAAPVDGHPAVAAEPGPTRAPGSGWLGILRRGDGSPTPVMRNVEVDPTTPAAGEVAADTAPPAPAAQGVGAGLSDSLAVPPPAGRPTREVTLSLTYPTLAIAGLAATMLLVAAFLAGKHFARPAGLTGPSMEQVRSGKTFPEVLNLDGGASRAAVQAPLDVVSEVETAAAGTAGAAAPAARPVGSPVEGDSRRVIGRNYIVAQSYKDEPTAQKAADLLQRNNIPVSVEQIDASPGWFCVVTRVGFDRGQGEELEKYGKLIREVNALAAKERLKKFEPWGYKWK